MTPAELKQARSTLGLSQTELAVALKLSDSRTIRYWEAGEREISGPAEVAIHFLLRDKGRVDGR